MPVSHLLCEGEFGSPDVRLLAQILRGLKLEIIPSGGKDGFSAIVRGLRQQYRCLCAIIDGDFPRNPDTWTPLGEAGPIAWTVNQGGQQLPLGWRWRRKEIENYLLDPEILTRTLGWSESQRQDYIERLEGVLDSLSVATAARMALTSCAPRKKRVDTNVDLDADEGKMEAILSSRAADYNNGAVLVEARLLEAFKKYLPDCASPDGRFRKHALEMFAGKNILERIQTTPGFARELKNWKALKERVIEALEKDEAPHKWLPEWTALRSAVESWTPPDEPSITTVAPPG